MWNNYDLSLCLKHIAAIRPKTIAAVTPPEAAVSPPVKIPSRPFSAMLFLIPSARRCPKPVSRTVAPAPANSTIGLYRPSAERITPATTNPVRIRAGVRFV